jgi:hypothetical protein
LLVRCGRRLRFGHLGFRDGLGLRLGLDLLLLRDRLIVNGNGDIVVRFGRVFGGFGFSDHGRLPVRFRF